MNRERRYKILVVSESSPHLRNFIDLIGDGTFELKIISSSAEYLEAGQDVTLVDFSFFKAGNYLKTIGTIRKTIREFRPDLIYIHQAGSVAFFVVLANRTFRIRTILTAWGSDVLVMPKRNALLRRISQFVLRSADALTSDSVYMAEEMKRLMVPVQKEIYIYNFGVQLQDLPRKKEKVIYSNRNHNPIYRIDKVIEAFGKFISKEHNAGWKLVLAGQGSETARLHELVAALGITGDVEFIGFVGREENFRNYARASYFVSVPESDATAISLLEAMYFECIPVLVDLPANREWVTHGKNGIIVSDINGDFLEEIHRYDISSELAANRRLIEEKASKEVCSRNFRQLIKNIIEK